MGNTLDGSDFQGGYGGEQVETRSSEIKPMSFECISERFKEGCVDERDGYLLASTKEGQSTYFLELQDGSFCEFHDTVDGDKVSISSEICDVNIKDRYLNFSSHGSTKISFDRKTGALCKSGDQYLFYMPVGHMERKYGLSNDTYEELNLQKHVELLERNEGGFTCCDSYTEINGEPLKIHSNGGVFPSGKIFRSECAAEVRVKDKTAFIKLNFNPVTGKFLEEDGKYLYETAEFSSSFKRKISTRYLYDRSGNCVDISVFNGKGYRHFTLDGQIIDSQRIGEIKFEPNGEKDKSYIYIDNERYFFDIFTFEVYPKEQSHTRAILFRDEWLNNVDSANPLKTIDFDWQPAYYHLGSEGKKVRVEKNTQGEDCIVCPIKEGYDLQDGLLVKLIECGAEGEKLSRCENGRLNTEYRLYQGGEYLELKLDGENISNGDIELCSEYMENPMILKYNTKFYLLDDNGNLIDESEDGFYYLKQGNKTITYTRGDNGGFNFIPERDGAEDGKQYDHTIVDLNGKKYMKTTNGFRVLLSDNSTGFLVQNVFTIDALEEKFVQQRNESYRLRQVVKANAKKTLPPLTHKPQKHSL